MKHLTIILFFISHLIQAQNASRHTNPEMVWLDVIEVKQGILQRHVLNDLPGMVLVYFEKSDGSISSQIIGRKALKNNDVLPPTESSPTVLFNDLVVEEKAKKLGYLKFASVGMESNEEIRFSITETSVSKILSKDINWNKFDEITEDIKTKNPDLPKDVRFGIINVASVIAIEHQRFQRVEKKKDISGWGFAAGSKNLSEVTTKSVSFKVGVSILVDDVDFPEDLVEAKSKLESGDFKSALEQFKGKGMIDDVSTLKAISNDLNNVNLGSILIKSKLAGKPIKFEGPIGKD